MCCVCLLTPCRSLGASSLTTLYIQGRIEPIDTYALSSPIVDFMGMHK